MFFVLSKILGVLASPLNLAIILILGGGLLSLLARRPGQFVAGLGVGIFVAFGIMPVGHNMMAGLEAKFAAPLPMAMPETIDGILVLGGAFNMDVSAARGVPALNAAAERLLAGVELARRYPDAALVFSGGSHTLRHGDAATEAQWTKDFLQSIGFDSAQAQFEEKSRNTYENLSLSKELLKPQAGQTWILVTSAWHMPRAAAVMQSVGWQGHVIFWPVDFRTDGLIRILPPDLDVASNMDKTSIALHERLGSLTYRLTGRINPN